MRGAVQCLQPQDQPSSQALLILHQVVVCHLKIERSAVMQGRRRGE